MENIIEYRGYYIRKSTDPWAIKYHMVYEFYIDGEKIRTAETIQDAKDFIDDLEDTADHYRNMFETKSDYFS